MKKYLTSLLFAACFGINIITAYADTSICQDGDPEKVIQCTYLTGLAEADHQRWIKISNNVDTMTTCTGSIEQSGHFRLAESYLPIKASVPESEDVSICTDASGSNCTLLKHLSFTCTTGGSSGQGSCTPDTVAIDLSAVKNHYPACNG